MLTHVLPVPAPNGRSGKLFTTYIRAQLCHENGDIERRSRSVKVQHDVNDGADVLWQEQLEWDYDIDEIAFLRSVFETSTSCPLPDRFRKLDNL